MKIEYLIRGSQFLEPCEQEIRRHRMEIDAGHDIHVGMKHGGYRGRVTVTIKPDDRKYFLADWAHKDTKRFPARIRAAATALFNCQCEGMFEISYLDGSLSIRAL